MTLDEGHVVQGQTSTNREHIRIHIVSSNNFSFGFSLRTTIINEQSALVLLKMLNVTEDIFGIVYFKTQQCINIILIEVNSK